MTLWPRSLFGRLALLLLLVILVSQATAIFLFRQDRAALLERQFDDTKIVQLKSLRAALATADPRSTRETLAQFGNAYQARIVPLEEAPPFRSPPQGPRFQELEQRLQAELGPGTELRIQPRLQLLWIKLQAGERAYWAVFPLTRPEDSVPSRALQWSLVALVVLLLSAYAFARYLARPLRQLNDAVTRVGEGRSPPPLPESGPSEIVNLNRGFNRMLTNLRQADDDRALLLAGVSHDLRTPLARLRLGVEVGMHDVDERAAMVSDIEQMDKIIGQFLDFARSDHEPAGERSSVDAVIAAVVERYAKAGRDVRFAPGAAPALPVRSTAMSRLVSNLVDNALRHGREPVEISTRAQDDAVVLEVADRGAGIRPGDGDRLKRPFTQGDSARTGAAGAGLGLAIVERIARMHRGSLDLVAREGGGMIARVTLPTTEAARQARRV